MTSLAKDFATMIADAGEGILATNLFVGKEPSDPANCVTVYETGGGEQDPKWAIDELTTQVRVRAFRYEIGHVKANRIKMALEGAAPRVVNGSRYAGFWCSSGVNHLMRDKNDRAIFTLDFRVVREPGAAEIGNRQPLS